MYAHICMNSLIGPGDTRAHGPCTSALGARMATVLIMGSLMLCHGLHPYPNILSPRFGVLTRWPWSGFRTGRTFLIGSNAPLRLLHIRVITPFTRFPECVPLLPLPLCRCCGPLALVTLCPRCNNHWAYIRVSNSNSRGNGTKHGLRVPNPNSRGQATNRVLRVPNRNSRGHATQRGLRVPNPNSRGQATNRGLRVPKTHLKGPRKKERKNAVPRLPLKEFGTALRPGFLLRMQDLHFATNDICIAARLANLPLESTSQQTTFV